MQRSGTLTKITPPLAPGTVPRPRLFRLLDGFRARSAIWVAGPAGSGKTTLLASYVARRRDSILWYQVDEGDADPASFFYFFRMAVDRIVPRRRVSMPLLRPEHVPALTTFTRNYFRTLFERVPGPGMLVFDNFQALPEGSPTEAVLRTAIEEVPAWFTIAVLSRELPPPAMRPLQGSGRLACLGWNDLRLEDREAARIVRRRGFSPDAGRRWIPKAGGWVAGLVLLMERARLEQDDRHAEAGGLHEYVFEYFAGQIRLSLFVQELEVGRLLPEPPIGKGHPLPPFTDVSAALTVQTETGHVRREFTLEASETAGGRLSLSGDVLQPVVGALSLRIVAVTLIPPIESSMRSSPRWT